MMTLRVGSEDHCIAVPVADDDDDDDGGDVRDDKPGA